MSPAHLLFDRQPPATRLSSPSASATAATRSAWARSPGTSIRRNIPDGGLVACRVPTDHLIVAGVSNWGAYALAAGVALLRGVDAAGRACSTPTASARSCESWSSRARWWMASPASRRPRVDGLTFDEYVEAAASQHRRDSWRRDMTTCATRPAPTSAGWRVAASSTGPTPGLALGLRAGQPRRRAARPGLRLPALLPAQPEAVPAARRDRARRPGAEARRPGRRPAHRRAALPRLPRRRAGRGADRPAAHWWRDDLVGFLLGCSFTFENALLQAGVPVRHIEQGCNVPMYRTNIAVPAGGRVSRADGRVDAADDAGPGGDGDAQSAAASRAPTARRSTSATRRPSASATSASPTSATR